MVDFLSEMSNDLSKYRLNADSELDVYRQDLHKFVLFQCDVYNMLDGLAIGDSINVCDVVVPESLDVFIKVVCLYILLHQYDGFDVAKIEFSDDYRKIYRRPGFTRQTRYKHFYSK